MTATSTPEAPAIDIREARREDLPVIIQLLLRDQRIGSRLMEWVIQRARERQCRLMQLTTNRARIDAQRFYQRLGFNPSHIGMKLQL